MPKDLVTAARDGKLVVFAGAGVSTESRHVDRNTFAERMASELGKPSVTTFAELMSEYVERYGRGQLLLRVRERVDYIRGFPDLERTATKFHHALATAYFLDQIITTNWDTYFEDYAGATPIVVPEDYAFWDLEGRKVFKLHGSMHNLGTIVATTQDYDKCYRRLRDGVIGATLKHLLATKRAVFVGYSFGDSDLNHILRLLRREMADVLPRSYLVSPHGYSGTDFPPDRVIETDGTYFIQKLKDAAVDEGWLRSDDVYSRTIELANRAREAHLKTAEAFGPRENPSVIHSLAYQDGLLHGFDRILALLPTGHYSNPHSTYHVVPRYDAVVRGAIRLRNYWDAAYALGYRNAMMSLDLSNRQTKHLPLYHVWGYNGELRSFQTFGRALKRASDLHRSATTQAERLVRHLSVGLIVDHPPYLDVHRYVAAVA
jgi:NAD-dependent SIR2 family protein deacetylase